MLQRLATAAVTLGLLLASGASGVSSQETPSSSVLARARDAIGGEARLRAINSLSANTSYRTGRWVQAETGDRIRMDPGETDFSAQVKIELPDKFLLKRLVYALEAVTLVNGNYVATGTSRAGEFVSAASEKTAAMASGLARREYLRFVVAWLLLAPQQYNVTFSDAGEAATAAGDADVVEATGAYDFYARLFFDEKTHLLTALAFDEPPTPRRVAGSEQSGTPPLFSVIGPAPVTPAKRQKGESGAQDEVEAVAAGAAAQYGGQMVVHFRDYRPTDGIVLPYRILFDRGSIEDWKIGRFRLNPKFDPRDFLPR